MFWVLLYILDPYSIHAGLIFSLVLFVFLYFIFWKKNNLKKLVNSPWLLSPPATENIILYIVICKN